VPGRKTWFVVGMANRYFWTTPAGMALGSAKLSRYRPRKMSIETPSS
jgi:hypothetical protein